MKPYYEHGGISIYHGDCREVLPSLPVAFCRACGCALDDESILAIHLAAKHDVGPFCELLLTDPPYGIGYVHGAEPNDPNESKFNNMPVYGDDKPFDPAHLLNFEKIVLWGGNHYADRLVASRGWLIWDKRCGTGSNDHSDCEMAWTNFLQTARIYHHIWNGFLRDSEKGVRFHPTQKPIELMQWCIGKAGNVRSMIDPYMGSGPTLLAAKKAGITAIGIEIEEKYCEIAAKRLSQEVFQF